MSIEDYNEFVVTGVYPAILPTENGLRSLVATHPITAASKAEAAKIFKNMGLLEIAPGSFVDSSNAVLISVLTNDEVPTPPKPREESTTSKLET